MPIKLRTCMLALLVPLTMPVWSADDLMTGYFVDQAHEWEQKDRPDLALEIWQKILLGDPSHAEALRKLGRTTGKNNPARTSDLPPKPAIIKNRQAVESTPPPVQPDTTRPAAKVLSPKLVKAKTNVAAPAAPAMQVPEATIKQDPAPVPEGANVAVESDQPVTTPVVRAVVLPKLERLKLKPSDTLELLPPVRTH